MKRNPIVMAVGASTATVMLLAGCSSGGGSSAAPANGKVGGKVTMLFDGTFKSALKPVIAAFEAKYPGTKVDVTYSGGDLGSVISTQLQAGTAPDIFVTLPGGNVGGGSGILVVPLASQQRLLDLSDSPWASQVPKTWQSGVDHKGKTYAYPGTLQGIGAAYNQTMLDKLGLTIPQTWTDVLALCDKAKSKGVYAYAQGLSDGAHMVYLALSSTLIYGPTPDFDQQQRAGKTTFENSPWKDVFTKYQQMNQHGCFGDGALGRTRAQAATAVASSKAIADVDVGAMLAPITAGAPKSKFAFVPLPATDSPAETRMPALPGYTLSVNAATKNPATAKAFLDTLAETDNINKYSAGFGSVPVIPNDKFTPPPVLDTFDKYVSSGKATKIPDWPTAELQTLAMQEVQALMLGKDSVDTVLKKMQDKFNQANK